ncbi:hypothetical protein [Aureimonas pseudogalii]|uniref:Cell division protein FtsX n=1 Tax=Aureimonas pseudogalii TaxID=1744844 RepID=A0A7W6MJW0_9HYPH|nr:hypothetical protein [Aureimonas pseudogalii]MBB3998668.1 cell division protein FtsX [Aureimonas pseudogalii]
MARAADTWRIAFSIYWKGTLLGLLAAVIASATIGFLLGFLGTMVGYVDLHKSVAALAAFWIIGLFYGFAAFNYVFARTIGVQFGQYRLELVKGPDLSGGI